MYFARIVFRPMGLERYRSIPWLTYVHPNVKKLKQAQVLVREGKLDKARDILVRALLTAPISPVTRELRDLLGDVNTQIFFSKEPSPRKTEYTVKRGDALVFDRAKAQVQCRSHPSRQRARFHIDSAGRKASCAAARFHHHASTFRANRVVVHDSRGFFTQYPIASTELPPTRESHDPDKSCGEIVLGKWQAGAA